MAADFAPVYRSRYGDAWRWGQLEQYEASFRVNVACARSIEQAIRDYFDDETEQLKEGCAEAVRKEYGFHRLLFVLSNTSEKDGRKHLHDPELLEWCRRQTFVPQDGKYNRYFVVDTAVALLDSFVRQTQQMYQALKLFGTEHCLEDSRELDYEGKVLILSPQTLKERYWEPKYQLWYAQDGFGCSPTTIGRSVGCTCLADGEYTSWDRAEFLGVIQDKFLPDWAKEAVERLQNGQTLGPETQETVQPMVQRQL